MYRRVRNEKTRDGIKRGDVGFDFGVVVCKSSTKLFLLSSFPIYIYYILYIHT